MWKKHGALDYKECMLDDATPPMVRLTFPKLGRRRQDETVWFSYITYNSRAHRDRVNLKVMAEMEKKAEKYKNRPMPFDLKRMSYAGFKVLVDI